MIDPKIFDDIAHKISSSVPTGMRDLKQDFDKNLQAALQSGLNKLNLVTREEFDVQSAVLARTRSMLKALEERIIVLEEKMK